MEKLYTPNACLKMAEGRMHTPHPTMLDPPLAISYRNHQKSLAYFSHLSNFDNFIKRPSQKRSHDTMPPPPPPRKYSPACADVLF